MMHNESDTIYTLDFRGHYIVPGLIDAHVHLGTDPTSNDSYEKTKERLVHLLQNGVTTVRDMAGDARYLNFISRQALLDEINAPDIYFSALVAGETFFKDPRTKLAARGIESGKAPWMRGINAFSDFNKIIAEAKGTGATGIKIYADLDRNLIQKVVDAAYSQELKVWAHSTVFPAKPSEVSEAGVNVMSHATYMAWEEQKDIPSDASFRHNKHEKFNINNSVYSSLMKMMNKNNTILDATISVYQKRFPDSTLYNYGVNITKLAYQNEVKIGIGSDVTTNSSEETIPLLKEMEALQNDVGMSPMDIIQSATLINAEILGKENEIGSIAPKKKANMIILKNNPATDIRTLESIVAVIKNGKFFNPN